MLWLSLRLHLDSFGLEKHVVSLGHLSSALAILLLPADEMCVKNLSCLPALLGPDLEDQFQFWNQKFPITQKLPFYGAIWRSCFLNKFFPRNEKPPFPWNSARLHAPAVAGCALWRLWTWPRCCWAACCRTSDDEKPKRKWCSCRRRMRRHGLWGCGVLNVCFLISGWTGWCQMSYFLHLFTTSIACFGITILY